MADAPHVEVFIEDGSRAFGFQCFTCGFEQTGVTDFVTAEEHAETHRCDPSRTDRQPPNPVTGAKGGETPVAAGMTNHPDLVTHHEET